MRIEARVYLTIGAHPCIPKLIRWDPEICCITLGYLKNGTLKEYIRQKHEQRLTTQLRYRWAKQAAEGIKFLHSFNIIHCDVSPRNFLLDSNLDLKISDFGGASISGSEPAAVAETRFRCPSDLSAPASFEDDIFSLGSLIYLIMTGNYPYEDTPSDRVEKLYTAQTFPDVSDLTCGDIILRCWDRKGATTAETICKSLENSQKNYAY